MIRSIILSLFILLAGIVSAQNITQTIRGSVFDGETRQPIVGAQIIVIDSNPVLYAETDYQGHFSIKGIPLRRVSLQVSYMGYKKVQLPNLISNSAKDLVVDIAMVEEITSLSEVTVSVTKNRGDATNEMALVSGRSISPEQTNRYAGGFNDPSKILSNFAGITSTQDGSNDVIVRGNSPKFLQWRMEGIQIPNPNHFGDQNSAGGSISTLNNNIIGLSDFYTGAFAPEYGDALSGVYDLKMRSGNSQNFEGILGVGILGTDITLEGPLSKNKNGASFLVNYRYSTISLVKDLGLAVGIEGLLNFQDGAFKINLPTKKIGEFSVFGIGGKSNFILEDVEANLWVTPLDRSKLSGIQEDFDKNNTVFNFGINHTINLNEKTYLKSTLAATEEDSKDVVTELKYKLNGDAVTDTLQYSRPNYEGEWNKKAFRVAITLNHKFNANLSFQIGSRLNFYQFYYNQKAADEAGNKNQLLKVDDDLNTMNHFISAKWKPSNKIVVVAGLHHMNVLFNKKRTLEPRMSVQFLATEKQKIWAGHGLHSTMESVHHYFTTIKQPDQSDKKVNEDLDLMKAHHFVLGYSYAFSKNLSIKTEAYYQKLYDLPVANDINNIYSTVNEGLDIQYLDLVNKGKGRNYGIEITLEKSFNKGFYALLNTSIYQSKFTPLDGIERNTKFATDYLVNALFGKEINGLGRKNNQILGINAKLFWSGGRKIIPLLRNADGTLAVDPEKKQFYDLSKAYAVSLDPIFQANLSFSYKWNKKKVAHELFLNIDNLSNYQGKISEFYSETKEGKIGYLKQFGTFPNLLYRYYF
jgi:CarboxypepD_reg-like domain/TonB-dependent Receptor Plug Domain